MVWWSTKFYTVPNEKTIYDTFCYFNQLEKYDGLSKPDRWNPFSQKLLHRGRTLTVRLKIASYFDLILSFKELSSITSNTDFVTFIPVYTSHKLVDSLSRLAFLER